MAYVVYYACDRCGNNGGVWINYTASRTSCESIARSHGWKIGKKGWFCPECQKKMKSEKRKERLCEAAG